MAEQKGPQKKQVEEYLLNSLLDPELWAQKRVLLQVVEDYLQDQITDEEFKAHFFHQSQGIKIWLKANSKRQRPLS